VQFLPVLAVMLPENKTKIILINTIIAYKAILSPYKPIIYYSGIFYQVIILKPCINLKKA
jgi:hypothetical protein